MMYLPIGPKVVPFWGSHSEFYRVIPKRNYFGAYGYPHWRRGLGQDDSPGLLPASGREFRLCWRIASSSLCRWASRMSQMSAKELAQQVSRVGQYRKINIGFRVEVLS